MPTACSWCTTDRALAAILAVRFDLPAIVKAVVAFVLTVVLSWAATAALRRIPGVTRCSKLAVVVKTALVSLPVEYSAVDSANLRDAPVSTRKVRTVPGFRSQALLACDRETSSLTSELISASVKRRKLLIAAGRPNRYPCHLVAKFLPQNCNSASVSTPSASTGKPRPGQAPILPVQWLRPVRWN